MQLNVEIYVSSPPPPVLEGVSWANSLKTEEKKSNF